MFYVNTLICRPGKIIDDLDLLKKKRDDYFVEISNISELMKMKDEIHFSYIDGAIEIMYDHQVLLDIIFWDLVDQLWSYILHVMEQVIKYGEGETLFPDQPIKLSMQSIAKDWVFYRLQAKEKVEMLLPKKEFFAALLEGAETFFQTMKECFPEQCNFDYELHQVNALRKVL